MKLEKSKNTKRNIVWGLLNKTVMMIFPFLIRTIFIQVLGIEYLGLNSLFYSVLQVLNLTEFGLGSAIVYSMYKPIADEDYVAIGALLCFYRKIYFAIGCIVLTGGMALLPVIPHMITGKIPDGINIYALYLMHLVNSSVSYFMFAYRSLLLVAYQRQDIISNTLTFTQCSMYVCQILILLKIRNYYVYVIVMPLFTMLNNLLNAARAKRLYPQIKCAGKITEAEKREIKRQVPGLMINKLCIISRNSFDNIFISLFLGLKLSGVYGNYYYIMNSICSLMSIFSNSMISGVGNSQIIESTDKNYTTMRKINFLYMWIAGWCTICLVCLYQPFVRIWAGEGLTLGTKSMILFCVYFYTLQMGTIRGVYSDAAGLWWESRYRALIESAANLVLNYILVRRFGIDGIIAATLISLLCFNFMWGSRIVFDHYFKNGKVGEYFFDHGIYVLVTLLVGGITAYICRKISFIGVRCIIYRGLICCILPNILYISIYYRTEIYYKSVSWLLNELGLLRKLRFLIPKKVS